MKVNLLQLVLIASAVLLTHSQEPAPTSPVVKLRNVDDPNKDPVQYSLQWITILEQLESSMNQWQFGARFKSSVESANLNISSKCMQALSLYFERPMDQEWTFKMWDSNGHFPSGIMAGSFFEPGNYDQCMEIAPSEIYGTGKYCILEIRMPHPIRMVNFTGSKYDQLADGINYVTSWDHFAGVANGICLPSVCANSEIELIVPMVLPKSIVDNFLIRTRLCQEPKKPLADSLRFGQKVAIAIIAANVALVLLGTLASALAPAHENFFLVLLRCFSIWNNSRVLFHINKSAKSEEGNGHEARTQFKFIHGLRVFSIYWVVFAHVLLFHPFLELYDRISPAQSLDHRGNVARSLLAHFIANGGLAVGTFFIISGALTIFSILPAFKKSPINLSNYMLLRWARFAPPSLGMICFILLWPLFGSGPLFHSEFTNVVTDACYTHWWANFLFITNLLDSTQMCNVMTWYLGADFQLHMLLYIVIYFFYRRRWLTYLFIGSMIVFGFVAPIGIVLLGFAEAPNPSIFLHPTHRFPMDQVGMFIFGTQNHLIPYFTGVILGLLLLRKKPLQISSVTCWMLWFVLFPLTMLLPFGSYSFVESTEPVVEPLPSAVIFGIVRLIWAAGIFWLCYECASGRARPIRAILSADILQPLSRLSFAIYLVHIIPVWDHYFSIRNPIPISMSSFMFIGVANCVYATLLAYILYLLFEAPYVNLMKLLIMPSINGSSSSKAPKLDVNNNVDTSDNGKDVLSMTTVSGGGNGQSHANTQT